MEIIQTHIKSEDAAWHYLIQARKYYTQNQIADNLQLNVRTVRRWELRQAPIKPYAVKALQALLPFETSSILTGNFKFIDLFAGIGGIRTAFEGVGGQCVFTSEWDSYAQT